MTIDKYYNDQSEITRVETTSEYDALKTMLTPNKDAKVHITFINDSYHNKSNIDFLIRNAKAMKEAGVTAFGHEMPVVEKLAGKTIFNYDLENHTTLKNELANEHTEKYKKPRDLWQKLEEDNIAVIPYDKDPATANGIYSSRNANIGFALSIIATQQDTNNANRINLNRNGFENDYINKLTKDPENIYTRAFHDERFAHDKASADFLADEVKHHSQKDAEGKTKQINLVAFLGNGHIVGKQDFDEHLKNAISSKIGIKPEDISTKYADLTPALEGHNCLDTGLYDKAKDNYMTRYGIEWPKLVENSEGKYDVSPPEKIKESIRHNKLVLLYNPESPGDWQSKQFTDTIHTNDPSIERSAYQTGVIPNLALPAMLAKSCNLAAEKIADSAVLRNGYKDDSVVVLELPNAKPDEATKIKDFINKKWPEAKAQINDAPKKPSYPSDAKAISIQKDIASYKIIPELYEELGKEQNKELRATLKDTQYRYMTPEARKAYEDTYAKLDIEIQERINNQKNAANFSGLENIFETSNNATKQVQNIANSAKHASEEKPKEVLAQTSTANFSGLENIFETSNNATKQVQNIANSAKHATTTQAKSTIYHQPADGRIISSSSNAPSNSPEYKNSGNTLTAANKSQVNTEDPCKGREAVASSPKNTSTRIYPADAAIISGTPEDRFNNLLTPTKQEQTIFRSSSTKLDSRLEEIGKELKHNGCELISPNTDKNSNQSHNSPLIASNKSPQQNKDSRGVIA